MKVSGHVTVCSLLSLCLHQTGAGFIRGLESVGTHRAMMSPSFHRPPIPHVRDPLQAFTLHDEFLSISNALLISFSIGTAVALLLFFLMWLVLLLDFRVRVLEARRGHWSFNRCERTANVLGGGVVPAFEKESVVFICVFVHDVRTP